MSKPIIISTSMRVGVIRLWPNKKQFKASDKKKPMVFRRFSFLSRGDSDKDRPSAIPMVSHVDWWTLTILLYHVTQPSGGFVQAWRLSGQESKSMSWLTNGILLASQEIKSVRLPWKRGPRQKEFGSEGCGKRISDTWSTKWKPNNKGKVI
jgi:hypothetical protein